MIELSYFCDELGTEDVREAIRLGTEAGATAIEIRSRMFGHTVNEITNDEVETLKGYLKEFDARVAVIGSGVGKVSLDVPEEVRLNIQRFKRMTELAHMFETDIIRVFAFWNPYWKTEKQLHPDLDAVIPQLQRAFEPIIEHAEKENVVLAFEPEADTLNGNCAYTRKIIDGIGGSDVLTVAWDCNNAARSGEIPIPEGYNYIRGLVRHVHVKPDKDNSIKTVANTAVSYRDIFQKLIDDGYKGPASVEHWGTPELMLEGIRQTRALLDEMGILKK
jgi:sugar phosphate isomerase/epimerase